MKNSKHCREFSEFKDLAMVLKQGRKVYFVVSIICSILQSVAAIDQHGNQHYIGTDAEFDPIASNISALQIDEPKPSDSKNDQPADASSAVQAHTHSRVVSSTAVKHDQEVTQRFDIIEQNTPRKRAVNVLSVNVGDKLTWKDDGWLVEGKTGEQDELSNPVEFRAHAPLEIEELFSDYLSETAYSLPDILPLHGLKNLKFDIISAAKN